MVPGRVAGPQASQADGDKALRIVVSKAEPTILEDGKSRRKRLKRQQLKVKKREAKQKKQQQQTTPNIPQNTLSTEIVTGKGVPSTPFTFASFLKPMRSFGSLQGTASASNGSSASIFDEQTTTSDSKICVTSTSKPSLIAAETETISKRNLFINCQSPILYRQDEGGEEMLPFTAHLSPLNSTEDLILSNEDDKTICRERIPVAGKSGAFSAPSSPVHSDDEFWESYDVSTGSASPPLEAADERKKISAKSLRRSSSLDFNGQDWDKEWALDSLVTQHKMMKEEKGEMVQELPSSSGQHGQQSRTEWRDTRSVSPESTDGGSSDSDDKAQSKSTSQSSMPYTPVVSSDEDEPANEKQEYKAQYVQGKKKKKASDHQDNEDEDDFSKKKFNVLYNPEKLKGKLQKCHRRGDRFFVIDRIYCGELQNEKGQYYLVPSEWVIHCRSAPGEELIGSENTRWHMFFKGFLEDQARQAREASTLSPALQQLKERLKREAEERGAAETTTTDQGSKSNNKNRLAGGKSAKWAAIKRKNKSIPGKSPKKVAAREKGSPNIE